MSRAVAKNFRKEKNSRDATPAEQLSIGPDRGQALGFAWACAAMALAVIPVFLYVHAFGVNVFKSDDWVVLPDLFARYDAHQLTWEDFWRQHHEHRILFPRLLMLGLGLLTHGNAVANMYATLALLLCNLLIFASAFPPRCGRGWATWGLVPVVVLALSLRQHENMLWGFQIGFVLPLTASLATFLWLRRIPTQRVRGRFLSAAATGTVAAFSSAQGLFVWPVGFAQLLMLSLTMRRKASLLLIWAGLGIAEWVVYFRHWSKPELHPQFGFSWEYLAVAVGGSLSARPSEAVVAGTAILACVVACAAIIALGRQWNEQSFWLATMLFGLASIAAITLGRSGFGVWSAIHSRYSTLSIPILIAVYAIFTAQRWKNRWAVALPRAACALGILWGCYGSCRDALEIGQKDRRQLEVQQYLVLTAADQPDIFRARQLLNNDTELVIRGMQYLKRLKFNVFAEDELCAKYAIPNSAVPVLPRETRCGVDRIFWGPQQKTLTITGWAVDADAGCPAGGVAVLVDGLAYPAWYGERNRQAELLLGDERTACGFLCEIPASRLSGGEHAILLKVQTYDHKAVFRASGERKFIAKQLP